MDIGWLRSTSLKGVPSGGNMLDAETINALSKEHTVEVLYPFHESKHASIRALKEYCSLLRMQGKKDIWIRDFLSGTTLPRDRTIGKNILSIYHIDSSVRPFKFVNHILEARLYRNLAAFDAIITMSVYWKKFFEEKGAKNVHVVYNAVDKEKFNIREGEVDAFKQKHHLEGKPIVFIGNCHPAKGVVESYEALKNLDVHLVTSGTKKVDLPIKNLYLSDEEYRALLKASMVVLTMSKFKEGWCRVAHEAMLCKTPVIGSGLGGMGELLEKGKQITTDFGNLKRHVVRLLNDKKRRTALGKNGYAYAKTFTRRQFEKAWLTIIEDLA